MAVVASECNTSERKVLFSAAQMPLLWWEGKSATRRGDGSLKGHEISAAHGKLHRVQEKVSHGYLIVFQAHEKVQSSTQIEHPVCFDPLCVETAAQELAELLLNYGLHYKDTPASRRRYLSSEPHLILHKVKPAC